MPRTGRPRQFDRPTALDAATQLFWQQGYESTSLDQLKQAMGGLSAASFYGAFGSKEKLYRETLAHYLETYGQVVAALYDPTLAPRDALEQALRRSAQLQTDLQFPRGCMVVLSVVNASPQNSHLQAVAAAERQRNRDAIQHCIARAVATGELRPDVDAVGFATLADALLVGMSIQARDRVSHEQIDAGVSNLLRLWDLNRNDRGDEAGPGDQD